MSKVLVTESHLEDIADSIRRKLEVEDTFTPGEMADAIDAISTGTDTSDATATANDIINTKTAYANGQKIVGTIPNNGALNYTPSTSQQTIPAGYTSGGTIAAIQTQTKTATPSTSSQTVTPDSGKYLSSVTVNAVTSSIDSNITAGNIKKDVSILGVTGTYEGSGTDTSDATATSADILSGQTAYARGQKLTGTLILPISQEDYEDAIETALNILGEQE